MNKFWIVCSHTFMSNAKTKSFIWTTLITALLVIAVFNIPTFISLFDKNKEAEQIGVVDASSQVFTPFKEQLDVFFAGKYALTPFATEEEAKQSLDEGKVSSYVLIEQSEDGTISGIFKALKVNDTSIVSALEQALNQVQFRAIAGNIGLTDAQAVQLFKMVSLDRVPLSENAKSEEELIQSVVLVYILLFAIYFAVMMYGNMIAMEVAKEKSSRVMEILISSVHPIVQLFGKILGTALLGIFQLAVFAAAGFISMQFGSKKVDLGGLQVDFSNLPISTIVYAVVFFILGYLLFAMIAAMLGSIVSRIEELQQIMTPMTLLIVVAFMLAMFGLTTPDALYIKITSFIPFFTPMIMFLRIGTSDPALWEIILSIGLLAATIVLLAYFAAKVYRGGVLMYGKTASLKDLKKAMTVHKD